MLVPAGSGVQWVFYALLFGGILAGVITIVLSPARRTRSPARGQEAGSRR